MEGFEVEVTSRQELGSGSAGRARRAGFLPSVVYRSGHPSVAVLVSSREFVRLGSAAKKSQIFVLKSNDNSLNGLPAIVKDVQIDPLKKTPIHVDFMALDENQDIEVSIVLKFKGESPGVKLDGGILTILRHEADVKCLPKNIPQEITVDISTLKLGQSLHIRDLPLPEGVRFLDAADETIVSVVAPKSTSDQPATAVAAADGTAAAEPAADAAGAKATPAKAAPAKAEAKK